MDKALCPMSAWFDSLSILVARGRAKVSAALHDTAQDELIYKVVGDETKRLSSPLAGTGLLGTCLVHAVVLTNWLEALPGLVVV